MLKADLHVHTREDREDFLLHSAKDLIRAASRLRFDVLAIANHNTLTYSRGLADYAKRHGIFLIPAMEAGINRKHVLLLNYLKDKPVRRFEELEKLREENVFVVAAHPFYPRYTCIKNMLFDYQELFDAVEVSHFYTAWFNRFNEMAENAAKKLSKPLIATSDLHYLPFFNTAYTLIDAEPDIDSLLEAIRRNRSRIFTSPMPLINYTAEALITLASSCFHDSGLNKLIYAKRRWRHEDPNILHKQPQQA